MNNNVYSYSIGDSVGDYGCTAIDDVDGPVTCTTSGSIDTSTGGDYDITYSAIDSSNNLATLVQTYTVSAYLDLSTYYDDAEGLEGTALEEALRTIINNGFVGVSYGDSRYDLDDTDADPNNSSNLILVYEQISISGVWDSGATWNREHVWPQSLLGLSVNNSSVNAGSDLHNLKPADPGTNSSRSNKYFDNMTTSAAYEPPDEVKGDIARILFYMVIMYDNLELVDGTPTTYEMGALQTLLAWNDLDPVDDFERDRNEEIYSIQYNRNPFIDYEHFVELIFGDEPYYNN